MQELPVFLLFFAQRYREIFFQNVFFLISQDILISLLDSSASEAGLSFLPLSKTERCSEPPLKFRLLYSLGAYRQIINFNEDQSINASTGRVMHIQRGFQQRLSVSLLDEPSRQGTMPSKRGIVETVTLGQRVEKVIQKASPDPHTVPQTRGQQIDPSSRTDKTHV